jgi:hypothetical protein
VEVKLLDKNIIINGAFNPSEIDRYFLIQNNIISEDYFAKMKTPPVFSFFEASFETDMFKVKIFPNRAAIYSSSLEDKENGLEKFTKTLFGVIKMKQLINFGINFDYVFELENQEQVKELAKNLFYPTNSPLFSEFFNDDNCNFGTYVSKDVLKARLRLDVKPVKNLLKEQKQVEVQGLLFKYNFHFEKSSSDISNILDLNSYNNECQKINNFILNLK